MSPVRPTRRSGRRSVLVTRPWAPSIAVADTDRRLTSYSSGTIGAAGTAIAGRASSQLGQRLAGGLTPMAQTASTTATTSQSAKRSTHAPIAASVLVLRRGLVSPRSTSSSSRPPHACSADPLGLDGLLLASGPLRRSTYARIEGISGPDQFQSSSLALISTYSMPLLSSPRPIPPVAMAIETAEAMLLSVAEDLPATTR